MSLQLITCRCGVSHGARLHSTMNSESRREATSIPLWSDRLLDGSISPKGNAIPAQCSGTVLQSVLAPAVFTGLEDIRAGGPQYHPCILATLRWAVRSSLPLPSPRKYYEGEGNPKPHTYGIQGFPESPLHRSCPLPASLKWATSSSLLIPSPKNMVRDEGNPKSHIHSIQ